MKTEDRAFCRDLSREGLMHQAQHCKKLYSYVVKWIFLSENLNSFLHLIQVFNWTYLCQDLHCLLLFNDGGSSWRICSSSADWIWPWERAKLDRSMPLRLFFYDEAEAKHVNFSRLEAFTNQEDQCKDLGVKSLQKQKYCSILPRVFFNDALLELKQLANNYWFVHQRSHGCFTEWCCARLKFVNFPH